MSRSRSAEHLRRATRKDDASLTVEARLRRALALGELGLEIYASSNGLTVAAARKALLSRRETMRRRSRAVRDL